MVRRPAQAAPAPGARSGGRGVAGELGLLGLSALLFALSFPSFVSRWGWFPLAFVCIAPLFPVIHRASWPRVVAYGPLYGFVSYALFNFWLAVWHPLGIAVVPAIYAGHFFLLFPVLKLIDDRFPRHGWLLQAVRRTAQHSPLGGHLEQHSTISCRLLHRRVTPGDLQVFSRPG